MSGTDVLIVRLYLHESKSQMEELLKFLHDESKVCGVTVFRGITGFGTSGKYHSSKLIDMSLDLPQQHCLNHYVIIGDLTLKTYSFYIFIFAGQ